jgi:hypothetical protein
MIDNDNNAKINLFFMTLSSFVQLPEARCPKFERGPSTKPPGGY